MKSFWEELAHCQKVRVFVLKLNLTQNNARSNFGPNLDLTVCNENNKVKWVFFVSFEVGQLTSGGAGALNSKRSSNSGLSDLPPLPYPSHSPRPGSVHHPGTRRTSSTAQNSSVPGSPILGRNPGGRGFSPVRDQRMFIASFCRLDAVLCFQ